MNGTALRKDGTATFHCSSDKSGTNIVKLAVNEPKDAKKRAIYEADRDPRAPAPPAHLTAVAQN